MGKFTNIVSAQITGNVGSMNFRRKDGEIVAAQRATTNSSKGDGASYAQRLHRVRIANIANLYRAIALIEKRGWENKGANQSDFNMFSKFNLAYSPVFLTKQEAELGAAVVAPYAVSRGSLSPTNGRYTGGTIFNFGLSIGEGDIDWDTISIPDFSARIIENNKGWEYGDKLSACVCHQITRTVSGVTVPQVEVVYLEITLDANSTQLVSDMGNWDAMQLDAANDHTLQFLDGGDAAFVIHSRETTGHLLTSEQDMVLLNTFSEIFVKYTSPAQQEAAMQSYGYKDAVLLDPNSENAEEISNAVSIKKLEVRVQGSLQPFVEGMTVPVYAVFTATLGGNPNTSNPYVETRPSGTSGSWTKVENATLSDNVLQCAAQTAADYRFIVNGLVAATYTAVTN